MTEFTASAKDLTVYATSPDGEINDLNAQGQPINNIGQLVHFIHELEDQGFFDTETRNALVDEVCQ
jgi:hypothetical protein